MVLNKFMDGRLFFFLGCEFIFLFIICINSEIRVRNEEVRVKGV